MKLSLAIAGKLLSMMESGMGLPASSLNTDVVQKMVDNGVLVKKYSSRNKALLMVADPLTFKAYLYNELGIADLAQYIITLSADNVLRSESVMVSGNSKLKAVRTFKGFLVNCFTPVLATWHGEPFVVQPQAGSFTFIYDYETFIPSQDITIVYIENPENFRYVELQQHLFRSIRPVFVSRYPYSGDLLKWLRDVVSNDFVYFGDLDFAAVNIYLNEYRKHLGARASFLVPDGVEELIQKYGNRDLYARQLEFAPEVEVEGGVTNLIELFHRYKRVVEQEVFIGRTSTQGT